MISNLIEKHYKWIMQTSYKYCKNRMDAEDLAGETILKIL